MAASFHINEINEEVKLVLFFGVVCDLFALFDENEYEYEYECVDGIVKVKVKVNKFERKIPLHRERRRSFIKCNGIGEPRIPFFKLSDDSFGCVFLLLFIFW